MNARQVAMSVALRCDPVGNVRLVLHERLQRLLLRRVRQIRRFVQQLDLQVVELAALLVASGVRWLLATVLPVRLRGMLRRAWCVGESRRQQLPIAVLLLGFRARGLDRLPTDPARRALTTCSLPCANLLIIA